MKKVFLGLSSGIDSTFALKYLISKKYNVTAVYMKLFHNKQAIEAEKRAMEIAHFFNIPFLVYDFQKKFEEIVINDFLEGIKKGETPNPCVVCNKKIKFDLFYKESKKRGADYIATGHYVKKLNNFLYKAKDKNKDQSYFLWQLSSEQIKYSLFPLGNFIKEEITKEIKKQKFIFERESQDICFIENKVEDFLSKKINFKKGLILTEDNKVIGEHKGVHLYTIGQRKGLDLSGGPFFVFKKDIKGNKLYVTKDEDLIFSKVLKFKNANWIGEFEFPLRAKARIRYRAKEANCLIYKGKVIFSEKQKAITSGQSIVFYKYNKLLGGGIIYE